VTKVTCVWPGGMPVSLSSAWPERTPGAPKQARCGKPHEGATPAPTMPTGYQSKPVLPAKCGRSAFSRDLPSSALEVLRSDQVCPRRSQAGGPVCRGPGSARIFGLRIGTRKALHLRDRWQGVHPEDFRTGGSSGPQRRRLQAALRTDCRDHRPLPGQLRQARGFSPLPRGALGCVLQGAPSSSARNTAMPVTR